MPKGINEQPPRAIRRGTKGSHASTETSHTDPVASVVEVEKIGAAPSPASSTKPTLAKQPTPPPPSSARSGSKSAEEAPQDGVSPKPAYATPGELLKAAAEMGEEAARDLLLRELRLRGWREDALELLQRDCEVVMSSRGSQLAFWIRRFSEIETQLSSLSFDSMSNMSWFWCLALKHTERGDSRTAVTVIHHLSCYFENPPDKRRMRFWMLGNLWRELEVEPNLPDTIAGWFRKLLKQTGSEQEVLLHLWRADHDRWEFDKITARNLRQERIEKRR